jgi:uncharacterized protein YhfF/transposase
VRQGKANARTLTRAWVLLKLAGGWDEAKIAETFAISPATVKKLRPLLCRRGLDLVLHDQVQQRRRQALTGQQSAHLIAISCSPAPDGHDHWTVRLLAGKAVELGFVKSISPNTISHVASSPGRWYHEGMKDDTALEQFWNDYVRSQPSLQGQRYYDAFRFGNTEQLANDLAALVLSGVKTASSSLLWKEKKPLMQVGDYSIVTDWNHHPVCIIQTTEVNIVAFQDVDAQYAYEYGEGDRTLDWWKQHLWDYYVQECAQLGRPATEEMPLVCERFRVVFKR